MLDCRFESRLPVEPLRIRLAAFLMSPLCWVLSRATARPNLGGHVKVFGAKTFPQIVQTKKNWKDGKPVSFFGDATKSKNIWLKPYTFFLGGNDLLGFLMGKNKHPNKPNQVALWDNFAILSTALILLFLFALCHQCSVQRVELFLGVEGV